MKTIKPIYFSTLLIAILSGCSSAKGPVLVSTDAANIDKTVLKTTPLNENALNRWSHLDLVKDTVPGMSVDKAYSEFLKGKKLNPIIVAVIDSGLDIDHKDLKGHIWVNKKEIPGNKIDDDKNGYVDDVNGWNFLGESTNENLELTRIVKKGDDGSIFYKNCKAELDEKLSKLEKQKPQVDMISNADKEVRAYLKKEVYTITDIKSITSTKESMMQSKGIMTQIATQGGVGFQDEIKSYIDYVYDNLNYNLNVNYDGRKVIGDNPENINDKFYGNANVKGPDVEDALHGTHVAGIIAQNRGNKLGGDGIASNAIIMPIRTVPNGDENDKDVALAIRYAVDNGAKIINASFGKDYSPHSEWVQEAIKYAESKDVLIFHAAGNDGKDLDSNPNFPTDEINGKEIADNLVTVGSLNPELGSNLVSDFSNYGLNNVDVFAPGLKIYATVPNNKYKMEQGTSMASPNAAGVAALVRSCFPKLTASQVKHIIMDSGTPILYEVVLGESKAVKKSFKNASKSGKMVNAYNALLMAEKMSKK